MPGTDAADDASLTTRGISRLKRLIESVPPRLGRISENDAGVKPSAGSWSIKEELGHLIDSAANNHQRFVLIQIQDNPSLSGYDQAGWVNCHQYGIKDWQWIIDSWTDTNRLLLSVAESVPPGSWSRTCTIADSGPLTFAFVLEDYIDHMEHHLKHIGVDVDAALRPDGYPEKKAHPDVPIADLIARRWSPVAFDEPRQVEREKLLAVLEAARWAPSCFNEQPWRYLVFDGSNPEMLERARGCLVEGNAWARKSPVLLLSVAAEDFAANGKPNRHAQHDVGLATENLVLEAARLGLAAHQMAGYDADRARKEFDIPERFTAMAMIAVGYPYRGRIEDLPDKVRAREARPRARRSVAEFAFSGRWNDSFAGSRKRDEG